jgi:hypothetical protein
MASSLVLRNTVLITVMIALICLGAAFGVVYHMRRNGLMHTTPHPVSKTEHQQPQFVIAAG